jgi:hypothetical protein
MRTRQIYRTDGPKAKEQTTNISGSLNKENYSNYNTMSCYMTKSNKSTNIEKSTNCQEDLENQFKHFF